MAEVGNSYLLVQVVLPEEFGLTPELDRVAGYLDLAPDQADRKFGIALLDPGRRTFAMRLTPDGFLRAREVLGDAISGPYSDPEIGPL